MAKITLDNVSYVYSPGTPYEVKALDNVCVDIKEGIVTGIIGHTGSGKSTFVQLLNGLEKPTSGKIVIDGSDIWERPKEISKIRFKVGLVMQYPEYQLFEETIKEDIAYGPRNMGLDENEIESRIKMAADFVGLDYEILSKSPFDLSGGQKRRVAIAGVLAMEPEIVVFDEPTAGLDPEGRETIFKAIADYQRQKNATVIIVSHSMEDIAAICDKVLVLNKGRVAMFDSTDKVFARCDELKALGLGVPMITEVFSKIKAEVPGLIDYPLTVKEGVEAIIRYIEKGGVAHD